jgi:NRPS condensation-like uncharacterized protein
MSNSLAAESLSASHPSAETVPRASTPNSDSSRCVRIPVNILEEIFLFLDRPGEPATMQFEFRVEGTIDEIRMRAALERAFAMHPMMQVALAARRYLLRPPLWEMPAPRSSDLLDVLECSNDQELAAIRDEFYSRPIDFSQAPWARALIVHRPGGDSVLLSIHHAIADGIGSLRFVNSVTRSYASAADPVPSIDPLTVRDFRSHVVKRAPRAAPPDDVTGRIADFTGETSTPGPGYGVCHTVLSSETCRRLNPSQYGDAVTLNDLLVAALHLSIAEWNANRGQTSEAIALLVPVNLRPAEWYSDVVVNLVFSERIVSSAEQRSSAAKTVTAVARQTARLRDGHGFARVLTRPVWFRRVIAGFILPAMLYLGRYLPGRDRGPWVTMLTANLGRIETKVADLGGEAGELTEFWSSPPAPMPMGIAMTTVILRGRLHISVRYHRALLDAEAARAFSALYSETIIKLGRGEA